MPDPRFQLDDRTQRERMLAGDFYLAEDHELTAERRRAAVLMAKFNRQGEAGEEADIGVLRELLRSIGSETVIRPPFYCDYGYNIHIGARSYANYGLVALDVGKITIGDDVLIGPNVQLLTATHPVEPVPRRAKWEGVRPSTSAIMCGWGAG